MISNTAGIEALRTISESNFFQSVLAFVVVMLILFTLAYINAKLKDTYVKVLFWYILGLVCGGALIYATRWGI